MGLGMQVEGTCAIRGVWHWDWLKYDWTSLAKAMYTLG